MHTPTGGQMGGELESLVNLRAVYQLLEGAVVSSSL